MAHAPDRGFFDAVVGDGRPALFALALGLLASGGAALFLAATGHFLPHDEQFLGMTADQLCGVYGGRVVDFMVHDRAAFGGVVFAIGLLYLWLAEFPLADGEAWAWWALLVSGTVGFSSFLTYAGTGYLDAWHGVATLTILPCFVVGMIRTRKLLAPGRAIVQPLWGNVHNVGRAGLVWASLGTVGGGIVILAVGVTTVFVPQDLEFLRATPGELAELNPRLIPLIAHDRAGFGGALVSAGVAATACALFGRPARSRNQVLLLAGLVGFAPAIGVHFAIGYTDPLHLAPALMGAALFAVGLTLTCWPRTPENSP